jgi:hypothetical protein
VRILAHRHLILSSYVMNQVTTSPVGLMYIWKWDHLLCKPLAIDTAKRKLPKFT